MEALPARILVVEDHTATRRFLADNLAADGYDPLEASSVADARELIQTRFPDVAIIDLRLTDGNGLDLLREVRETDRIASRVDPGPPGAAADGPRWRARPGPRLPHRSR